MTRVRPAEPRDFAGVTRLLAELGRPPVTAEGEPEARAVYQRQMDDPDVRHLVAEDEAGALVGFCAVHLRERLNLRGREVWIPDLIVTEVARRRGIAGALLGAAEQVGRAGGCVRYTLESGYERTEAHALYLSAGMTDGGKFFWKLLR